jgi:hypothetical protein
MTSRVGRVAALVMCVATMAAPAMAQDEPRFALVASLPTPTVSLQWELSDKFALRFDGSYIYRDDVYEESIDSVIGGSIEHVYSNGVSTQIIFTTPAGTPGSMPNYRSESITHRGSIGVAGIFTLLRTDRLRLYASPRISVAWLRERITTTLPAQQTLSGMPADSPATYLLEESSTSPGASGSFGAAATVHRHVALFGEVGLNYTRTDTPNAAISLITLDGAASKSTAIGTRAIAGVMVLF